jgi:hypothetical protein
MYDSLLLCFYFPVKSYYLSVRNNVFKFNSARMLQYNGWSDVVEFQIELDTNNSLANTMYLFQSSTPSQSIVSSKLVLNPNNFPLELVYPGMNNKSRINTIGTKLPWKQDLRMNSNFHKKCCKVPIHSFGVKSVISYGM